MEFNSQSHKRWIWLGAAVIILILVAISVLLAQAPTTQAKEQQFVVPLGVDTSDAMAGLSKDGLIKNRAVFDLLASVRGLATITPGGYELSASMNAWQIAGVLKRGPDSVWVVIPEGLRKEEIADILAKDLAWTSDQEKQWITVDTNTNPDYFEGVYFPDTYLIPKNDTTTQVADRLRAEFEEQFAPYATEALKENIKWTTALTVASIVQREAAGKGDMPTIAAIIWNRLLAGMRLDIDSTVQYARGNIGQGWWAPIKPSDEQINSPYNTYRAKALPPHPISNPGIDAIAAALNPASTTCLYYLHDNNKQIHCSDTYGGQLQNIQTYLK